MRESERLPDELAALFTLDVDDDSDPGPAAPLDSKSASKLVAGAIDGWSPQTTATADAGAATSSSALWLGGVVLCAGAAAALYLGANRDATPPAAEGAKHAPSAGVPAADHAATPSALGDDAPDALNAPNARRAVAAGGGADLLALGNRLRGEGRYAEAERTYLRVVETAPDSAGARVARVAVADLRLERLDDPAGALPLYRAAAADPGPLSLEAQAGLARTLRALGQGAKERQALERLVTMEPSGASTSWARERLDELAGTIHEGVR